MVIPSRSFSSPQTPKSAPKAVSPPKDSSLFRGRTHIERHEVRSWLGKDDVYRISKIPRDERIALERKLFPSGQYVSRREVEKTLRILKDFPEESAKKFGLKTPGERGRVLNIVKKILGK